MDEAAEPVSKPLGGDTRETDLGYARIDTQRASRCGVPEVIFGQGKAAAQIVEIASVLVERHGHALATRVSTSELPAVLAGLAERGFAGERVRQTTPRAEGFAAVLVGRPPAVAEDATPIPIVTAGTSDSAVAEEAVLTCEALGQRPRLIADVGVAGLHRLMHREAELRAGHVVVVVAGMEGALPSVVGGLVDVPVVAVPTSVGYGASFQGLSALLCMLNSCASGVIVVNIDNGFGAAFAACQITRRVDAARRGPGPAGGTGQ